MFGIGFQELVLLSLIGLVVLGPERLPRVANQIGGWLGQARRMTRVMKRQLEDELDFEKEFSIKPSSREPSTQPGPAPDITGIPSADDHYSAAHDAESPDPVSSDLPAAAGQAVAVESAGDDTAANTADATEEQAATEADQKEAPKDTP